MHSQLFKVCITSYYINFCKTKLACKACQFQRGLGACLQEIYSLRLNLVHSETKKPSEYVSISWLFSQKLSYVAIAQMMLLHKCHAVAWPDSLSRQNTAWPADCFNRIVDCSIRVHQSDFICTGNFWMGLHGPCHTHPWLLVCSHSCNN